jgi:kumamolisin
MGPAWLGALLPEAKIVIYEMALDLPDPWLAAVEMVAADEANAPDVLCITWTQPEESYYRQYSRSSIALALAKAAALGITVVVGAGDWGVYDGRPGSTWQQNGSNAKVARAAWPHATFPSTEERVLSVGGTLVTALDPVTEVGWSGPLPPDPELARELPFISLATSGGFSQRVPIPDWQYDSVASVWSPRVYSRGTNLPAVLPYGRGFPDVSLMAAGPALARGNPPGLSATGYQLVIDGKWIEYAGGTSLAAPIWAALIAAFNEERARSGRESLGFVNPLLYYLARTRPLSGKHAVFRPINDGSSDIEFRVVTGEGQTTRHVLHGYEARADWDPVTGLGVPRAARLAQELAAYPPSAPKAASNGVPDELVAPAAAPPPVADVLEGA